jgi:hypothetical protein
MRINVYSQELTKDFELVEKESSTGVTYYGIRLYLASADELHQEPDDDDRSAITFWLPNAKSFSKQDLADLFYSLGSEVEEAPDVPRND